MMQIITRCVPDQVKHVEEALQAPAIESAGAGENQFSQ